MGVQSSQRQWLFGLAPLLPLVLIGGGVWLFRSEPADSNANRPKNPPAASSTSERDTPPEVPTVLPTEDEVVAPDSPLVQFRDGFGTALGVGGYIWLSADEGGSTIEGRCEPESDCTKAQPTSLCVRGEVGQVLDGNWGAHWGAALGWNLAQDAEPGSRVSVLRAPSVRGFEFDLALDEGSSTEMRLSVRSREVEFCAQLAPGKNSIRWNDLKANCWEPGGEGLDPEVETVTAVKWQLVSQEARPLPFDFCVENLTLL